MDNPPLPDRKPTLAEIQPFRGVYYNQAQVKDLAAVICPPYDIISPPMQQDLYERSEFNFVRVEFARELPQDRETDNRYTRAADTMGKWLERGVLVADRAPALYLHEHVFTCYGREYRRHEIIGRVRLEEWDRMVVRPHEGTLSRPKGDRLNMLWALQADTSPILSLFEDRGGGVASILGAASKSQPLLAIDNAEGEGHRLWAIRDRDSVRRLSEALADRPLYIADGHHRYESALAYMRERRACASSVPGEEPYDFVMMNLVSLSDPGLVVLPAHRLIRGVVKSVLDGLFEGLRTFFDVREVPLDTGDIGRQVDELLVRENDEVRVVICGLLPERLVVIRLRDFGAVSQMIPYFHSEIYKSLDISIVDHVILEEMLGLDHEEAGTSIHYSYDGRDAVRRVLDQEYQLAFIINPVKPETIKAVADSGDRMPRKSTYFYPKAPAGLVFYRFG
jgi:uncharacterized protein (DUF1015 family)